MAGSALFWVFALAALTTVFPLVLPWLQAERGLPIARERRVSFLLLGLNALTLWILLGDMRGGTIGPAWLASGALVLLGDLGWGLFLAVRGYPLPDLTRIVLVIAFCAALPACLATGLRLAGAW